ncbi:MAG: MFS transporter [Chthoniobacteraceae bacterium]
MPVPPSSVARDPYAAFRVPAYRLYSIGYFISVLGRTGVSVAIGYELYQRTHSATALGLIGLVGALPVILLALPAGHLADRANRKTILMTAQIGMGLGSLFLFILSMHHAAVPAWPVLERLSSALEWTARFFGEKGAIAFDPAVPLMFGALFLNSCARAFGWAARGAFVANLLPRALLTNAITWNTSLFQMSGLIGPALAGLVIATLGVHAAYALDVVCGIAFFLCLAGVRHTRDPATHVETHFLSGLRFVWRSKVILGAITLDLFAVLVGGATALLPVFAEEILHVDARGLGMLRAAPSLGALVMGFTLAHLPPLRRAGVVLLWSVVGFGLATVLFGVSQNFVLSFVALALTGALDNVSVVVRHTLVQLLTPDAMRGRVSAVNNVFINSSNELGQLESGLTAALFGVVGSVVGGGIGVILVVLLVAWYLPEVRKIGTLHDLEPEGDP